VLRLAKVRSELGFRTIFNAIGPLSHPAGPINRIVGVPDPDLLRPMAGALGSLGVSHALVVSGSGLDELSLDGESRICELRSGVLSEYTLSAPDLGLAPAPIAAFRADSPEESAGIIRSVLHGEEGPCRDIVLLNAAGAILVGGGAADFSRAVALAETSVDSGRAADVLLRISKLPEES
jgi:anthranilate phosphoribosyltransferase